MLAVLPFSADTADPMMAVYRRRLFDQIMAEAEAERMWETVKDPAGGATHVLSGSLTRQGNSVRLFTQLVIVRSHRHLWADSTLDSYAFSGNSTIMADRIEKSVARILESDKPQRDQPLDVGQRKVELAPLTAAHEFPLRVIWPEREKSLDSVDDQEFGRVEIAV